MEREYKHELQVAQDLLKVKVTLTHLQDGGYQALNEERKHGDAISSEYLIREIVK